MISCELNMKECTSTLGLDEFKEYTKGLEVY
jgi:hypothetical protein